jgi:hypothetical protein
VRLTRVTCSGGGRLPLDVLIAVYLFEDLAKQDFDAVMKPPPAA